MRINKMTNVYDMIRKDPQALALMQGFCASLYCPGQRPYEGMVAIKHDLTREPQLSQEPVRELNQSGRIIATRTILDPNLEI